MSDAPGDAARRAILARRARFVAAAVAGLGIACGKEPAPQPEACLKVAPPVEPDAQVEVKPVVCLSVATAEPVDAGEEDATRPAPRACLRVAPPKDKK